MHAFHRGIRQGRWFSCLAVLLSVVAQSTALASGTLAGLFDADRCGRAYADTSIALSGGSFGRPPLATVRTARLTIGEMRPGDNFLPVLHSEENVARTALASRSPAELRQMAQVVTDIGVGEQQSAPRTSYTLTVRDNTGAIIGFAQAAVSDADPGIGTIAYFLNPSHSGRGYAQEMAYAMTKFAFERLGVREVHAEIHPDNVDSKKVAARTGFEPRRTGSDPDSPVYETTTNTSLGRQRREVWVMSRARYNTLSGQTDAPVVTSQVAPQPGTGIAGVLATHRTGLEQYNVQRAGVYITNDRPIKEALSPHIGVPVAQMALNTQTNGSALYRDTVLVKNTTTGEYTLVDTAGRVTQLPPASSFFDVPSRAGAQVIAWTRIPGSTGIDVYLGTQKMELTVLRAMRGSGITYQARAPGGETFTVSAPQIWGRDSVVRVYDADSVELRAFRP